MWYSKSISGSEIVVPASVVEKAKKVLQGVKDAVQSTKDIPKPREHKHLDDYKPFRQKLFSLSSLLGVALSAAHNPLLSVVLEFESFLLKQENGSIDQNEAFPWSNSFWRHFSLYPLGCLRVLLSNTICSTLESGCFFLLPPRITDKLTKDIFKSHARKLVRHSRLLASYKIFFSHLTRNVLTYSSFFLYDLVVLTHSPLKEFFRLYYYQGPQKAFDYLKKFNAYPLLAQKLKERVLIYSFAWLGGATGFAVGSLFSWFAAKIFQDTAAFMGQLAAQSFLAML
jgi:hypothetical protein